MKKRQFIKFLGIGSLGVLTILQNRTGMAASKEDLKAKILDRKGKFSISGKLIQEGISSVTIAEGDILETLGEESFVQLALQEGHSFQIKGKIKLLNWLPNKSSLRLLSGTLFGFIVKGKPYSNLEVSTTEAVMGVRGTKFLIESKLNQTYICLCEGSVEVKNSLGAAIVQSDQDVYVTAAQAPKPTEASSDMKKMIRNAFSEMGFPTSK